MVLSPDLSEDFVCLTIALLEMLMQLSQLTLGAILCIKCRVANQHITSHLCDALSSNLIDKVTDPRGYSGQVY
jgi:hypothetical protein